MGSLYATTDSILRARPVFDWILLEHHNIISNSDIYSLMQDEEFFTTCHQIRSVWTPIKECINILEAKSASLADCFGINDDGFRDAAITATTLWQSLEFHQSSGVSSQADCERNFSMLKWIIGDRRVRLDIKKLEDLSSAELREIANISAVGNIISLNDKDDDITDNILLEGRREMEIQTCTNLVLEDFIDLSQTFDNIETVNLENNDNVDKRNGNMNFDPIT
ncbi:unnamed protein product [Rhizophagus irregularis]|uniref:Uncharacterized protein n=2 Tax=Rhizophagus irregularis TaxID=588596 RepID=A0A916ELN8_9GLOM|nr:unnamed protein product [Rhizophagus irregularis]CAB5393544.1 unnamed protein product [Rhizophagus irregularis]